jgi:N-acetylglucosaminyldiphosphoundecaprenol N-acetyl-beta-D-mannosaminyltransferase
VREADILGIRVHSVTLQEAVDRIVGWVAQGGPHQVVTANAEIIWRAWHDPELARVLEEAALVTADGVGVLWASRRLGQRLPQQVAGIDLVEALAERGAAEGWKFFLYGARPGVAEAAAERLKGHYPGLIIAGTAHGYQTENGEKKVIEAIRAARPHVLLVALGSPRQELWIARHNPKLGVPVAIGVGGSLDVLAGRVRRAPQWVRRLGLEWLYRLVREPRRWRRQMVLPAFAWKVLLATGRRAAGPRGFA